MTTFEILWPKIKEEIEAPLRAEIERLRGHIEDIAAHATPFGDLPEEPGFVGSYLLSAGALHRALGTIGHTAASCPAEADRDRWKGIADGLATVLKAHVDLGRFPVAGGAYDAYEAAKAGEAQ